ncbi:MAG: ABC transporter substrate-binding protein, partial [Pseudolabrys sp.]
TQALTQLGWSDGHNLRIDTRYATADDIRRHAAELAALAPDVLVAGTGTATVAPLLQATRTVPIVFAVVIDPVGAGFVDSLARPGGNATGFTIFEYSMSGKWLELLKEIAPNVTRVAVLRDPAIASGIGQFGAVQIVAPSLGVGLSPVDVRDAGEIERAVAAFASGPNGGLVVTGIANWSPRWPPATNFPRCTPTAPSSQPVASSPTVPITSTSFGGRPAMSIASSRARSRPTCRCRRRPSTSW